MSRQRCARAAVAAQPHAERGVADRAGDHDAVARPAADAPHHPALRHGAERGDRDRHRSGRVVGVAAEQRAAVVPGILAETRGEGREPASSVLVRQRDRQQKAERLRALGGKIGEIHAQRLAGDRLAADRRERNARRQ